MILNLLEWTFKLIGLRQSVRVLCHTAFSETNDTNHTTFITPKDTKCLFINVVNHSIHRDVEVTHVWIEHQGQISVLNPERKLPYRLKPDQSWETWIKYSDLPENILNNIYNLARVKLSNGKVLKSRVNKNVPSAGNVAGS